MSCSAQWVRLKRGSGSIRDENQVLEVGGSEGIWKLQGSRAGRAQAKQAGRKRA